MTTSDMVTTRDFVQPEIGKSVVVYLSGSDGLATGVHAFMAFGGTYLVGLVQPNDTAVRFTNIGGPGNLFPGSVIGAWTRVVATGPPGPVLGLRFNWLGGGVSHKTIGAGIGTDNANPKLANHLLLRGHSGEGGPNPVNLWAKIFNGTSRVKGEIVLWQPPYDDVWISFLVLGYQTLSNPQVQDFSVEVGDVQALPRKNEPVFFTYTIAGDRGEA